ELMFANRIDRVEKPAVEQRSASCLPHLPHSTWDREREVDSEEPFRPRLPRRQSALSGRQVQFVELQADRVGLEPGADRQLPYAVVRDLRLLHGDGRATWTGPDRGAVSLAQSPNRVSLCRITRNVVGRRRSPRAPAGIVSLRGQRPMNALVIPWRPIVMRAD